MGGGGGGGVGGSDVCQGPAPAADDPGDLSAPSWCATCPSPWPRPSSATRTGTRSTSPPTCSSTSPPASTPSSTSSCPPSTDRPTPNCCAVGAGPALAAAAAAAKTGQRRLRRGRGGGAAAAAVADGRLREPARREPDATPRPRPLHRPARAL
ncbi:Protein of unknown function [Gryllus bimaculatus]|nr:Protein of unknown function [Gryllus bimaculatus]